MSDMNPSEDDVDAAFRRQIVKALENATAPKSLLQLAEAWAWVQRPGQSHGGGAEASS